MSNISVSRIVTAIENNGLITFSPHCVGQGLERRLRRRVYRQRRHRALGAVADHVDQAT
jgi:hypothetical protein